jgi:ribosome small subunit-dependent GTPase A
LAANIDSVVIAVSLAAPLNAGRVERLLALAWDSGAKPVVVLTKADVADDPGTALAVTTALAPGVDIVTTSSTTGTGLDVLSEVVTGTTVPLGPSGAGKSTLANALLGREHMGTSEVRASDGKGRHTTAHRESLPLPGGGVLIDTPGLRGIGLQDAADGVERVFAEIEALLIITAAWTGCRWGELAGLQRNHLNLNHGTPTIDLDTGACTNPPAGSGSAHPKHPPPRARSPCRHSSLPCSATTSRSLPARSCSPVPRAVDCAAPRSTAGSSGPPSTATTGTVCTPYGQA